MAEIETFVASRGREVPVQAAASARAGRAAVGASDYFITVRFLSGLTESQKGAFKKAALRWTEVIKGDLPPVRDDGGEVIDDLLILAQGQNIDGPGRILGQAGPTRLRPRGIGNGALLPAKGEMTFDTADLEDMEERGTLNDVIAHEMGHVIGIGTVWRTLGLIKGAGTANPRFTGKNAMREFGALNGNGGSAPVPVENTGGPGTRDGPWRDTVFGNELMTGFVGDAGNPLSRMTVASLQDMGYIVDMSKAEPYSLPGPAALAALGVLRARTEHDEEHALRTIPIILPPESVVS